MAKNDNLKDFLTDLADAIREKKGTEDLINPQDFSDEIKNLPSGSAPRWTGHADVEGLKAIGWDDDDIAYYQEHGVNWNEEDDEYHKVSDDNKALYGVLTANNIQTYRDRIVYLPKIDTSKDRTWSSKFAQCKNLVALPFLNTSNVTDFIASFNGCTALVCVPLFDTSKATNFRMMFYGCKALSYAPLFDTSKATSVYGVYYGCHCLTEIPHHITSNATDFGDMLAQCRLVTYIPPFDTSKATSLSSFANGCSALKTFPSLDTSEVTTMDSMIRECSSLTSIPPLDTSKVTNITTMLWSTTALERVQGLDVSSTTTFASFSNLLPALKSAYIKGLHFSLSFSASPLLTKESLLYIINNEAATEPITITLAAYAYTRLAEDADVVAALANHPNVSLAK